MSLICTGQRMLALFSVVFMLNGDAPSVVNYYVSPDGDDSNPGTFSSPFRTPYGARNKIREMESLPAWTFVHFREGRYGPLSLGAADSGSETNAIRYVAYSAGGDYAPEKVVFDGGADLDVSSAYIVTNATWLGRIEPSAQGNVYCIDSVPESVVDNLSGQHAVVTMDGKLMVSSRWPDLGYAAAGGSPTGETTIPLAETIPSLVVSEFQRTADMYLAGYLYNDWYKELKAVTGLSESSVTFSGTGGYGVGSGAQVQILNVLAELDEEGEFYYDKASGAFFFWPFGGTIASNSYVSVADSVNVIRVSDCVNVGFQNIIVQNGATCGIQIERGLGNSVVASTVRNCRYWGVCVGDPYSSAASAAGADITVQDSDIYDCGLRVFSGGVNLTGGYVSNNVISPARNRLKNCHIWNIRNIDSGDRGIRVSGVGHEISMNLIHNILGNCVWVGNDHTIEYNELFGIALEKGDGAALYTANTFWTYGNNVQYNFIHHILTKPGMHMLAGLYYDHKDAGDVSRGNVFYKAGQRAILWNGGAGQKALGNLFVECEYGLYNELYDAADSLEQNRIGLATEAVVGSNGWNNSPWTKYPLFGTIMNQTVERNMPIECSVLNNVFVDMCATQYAQGYFLDENKNQMSYADAVEYVIWTNNCTTNNILKDPDVLNLGYTNFEPEVSIDFDSIGLHRNIQRSRIPNKDTYRRFVKTILQDKEGYAEGTYDRATANSCIYYNFRNPMWEVYDGMPMKYRGLVLWLDGADRSTTLDHDWQEGTAYHTFKYWMDKSGCGNHFFQYSDGKRPLTNLDQYGINGLSTPDFPGTDEYMVSDMTLGSTGTMFVAVRHDVNAYDVIFSTEDGQLQLRDSGNNQTGVKYNSIYSSFAPSPAAGVVKIYSVVFLPGLQKWYCDGELKKTEMVSGFESHTQTLILGAGNASGNSSFDGEIAEMILYDRTLSDTVREDVENYLTGRWQ